MRRAFPFVVCLLLWWAPSSPAQYRFDSWTTDNGLPQNGVRGIVQSPDGYLWFTTFDGLVRFDGATFAVFDKNNSKGIASNRFFDLYLDPDGTLVAAHAEFDCFRGDLAHQDVREQLAEVLLDVLLPQWLQLRDRTDQPVNERLCRLRHHGPLRASFS